MSISKKLRNLRGDQSHRVFGKKVGVSDVSLIYWERGDQEPKLNSLKKIADACGVDISYFYDDLKADKKAIESPEHYEVQIVGMVPAGHTEIYDEPPVEPPILLPFKEFKKCIAVRVDGNSMERLFYDGDILFIQERSSQLPRKDGFTYVIEWEEHERLMRAVKNVYREKDGFRLVSENKTHRDIVINNIRRLYRIVGVFNREFRYQINV